MLGEITRRPEIRSKRIAEEESFTRTDHKPLRRAWYVGSMVFERALWN